MTSGVPPESLLVNAESVTSGYGSREVLRGIDFTLSAGELVGLVGPNGSGKTTLLHCLTGYQKVTAGTVKLSGRDVKQLSRAQVAEIVSFVPQHTDSVYSFSVLEMVLMGRHPFAGVGMIDSAKDITLAEEALTRLEISHLRDRDFSRLSGGERQMVLLARTFAQQAPVLMLDEPLTGLDIRHQFQIMSAIRTQCVSGKIGALATFHDLGAAARWCTRMVLLRAGQVIDSGVPADVITVENMALLYDVDAEILPGAGGLMGISVSGVRPTEHQVI